MTTEQQIPYSLRETAIDSYNQKYDSVGILRETDAFYHWVLHNLGLHPPDQPNTPRSSLLDVASGEGHLVRIARRRAIHAYAVDFSDRAMLSAQKTLGQNIVTIGDGETLPFAANTFDYVTNLGSLEHFASPDQGLQEMHRVVKPQGKIGLMLPNSYYWLDIVWHVWRTGHPVTHSQVIERFATAGQWRTLIETNRFQVDRVYKYNLCWPATFSDIRWYLRSPQKLAYPLLSPITPHNLSYSFFFLCSPV